MIDLSWMAWTAPTAAFFGCIAAGLVIMTVWQIVSPSEPRRGVIGLRTSRGDRFFVSLLGSGYIHLAWIGLADGSMIWPAVISTVFAIGVFRWV